MKPPSRRSSLAAKVLLLGWLLVSGGGAQQAPDADGKQGDGDPVGGNLNPVTQLAEKTSSERYDDVMAAYEAREYGRADALFTEYFAIYGGEPTLADRLGRMLPLHALTKLRLKEFDAALPMVDAALAGAFLGPEIKDELAFWRGLCLMRVAGADGAIDHRAAQRAFGEYYRDHKRDRRQRARCHESLLLFGVCNTLMGEHADAAEFFAWQMPRLRRESPEAAARATLLLLYSLLESGEHDSALEFVVEQYADIGSVTQLISFQSLALDLGSRFLDDGEYHKAITCLQRVWKRERLLEHQRAKQADLEAKLEILKARGLDEFVFRYDGMRRRVERELASFEKIEDFDAALRLRLATAFQGLGRYREAALVMEEMLATMPADEIVAGASITLMQCWMEIGRWGKAIAAAGTFATRFGGGDAAAAGADAMPSVLFLKGRAQHNDRQLEQALETFRDLYRRFPESGVAGDALFMQGIVLLSMERNREGVALFEDMRRELPDHRKAEDAFYWQGMGHSFAGEHLECRGHLAGYLSEYPRGRYEPDAIFRRAFALFSLADYQGANGELSDYLSRFDGDAYNDEARLLLGDGLLALGALDEGVAAYKSISTSSTRFFEDGWFKVGKVMKLRKGYGDMREHFSGFVDHYPDSGRMAEAVYWVGWAHNVEGDGGAARDIYWATIREHGDRPDLYGIADLCDGLRKLYPGEGGRDDLALGFGALAADARKEGKATLELHAQWAAARNKDASLATYRVAMGRAVELLDPRRHNPRLIADCADFVRSQGDPELAARMFTDLRKWHPRAIERDRAFIARAEIARDGGDTDSALELIARLEEEVPFSGRLTDALLLKADLLVDAGRDGEALAVLDRLLEDKMLPSSAKARALFRSGEVLAAMGEPLKATAYFERVYVAYGKFLDLVAASYLRRAELLESLDRREEAVEVYRELASREDLRGRPEPAEAKSRLGRLGAGMIDAG